MFKESFVLRNCLELRLEPRPRLGARISRSLFCLPLTAAAVGFDAFGDVLQPQLLANSAAKAGGAATTPPTTTVAPPAVSAASQQSLFKGDLDSSLASLAQNLDINGPKGGFKKY